MSSYPSVTLEFADYSSLLSSINFNPIYVRANDVSKLTDYSPRLFLDTPVQLLDDSYSIEPSILENEGNIEIGKPYLNKKITKLRFFK